MGWRAVRAVAHPWRTKLAEREHGVGAIRWCAEVGIFGDVDNDLRAGVAHGVHVVVQTAGWTGEVPAKGDVGRAAIR